MATEGAFLRRLAVILVVFALIVEYIVLGAMGMRVSRLESQLALARNTPAIAAAPAFPVTLDERSPELTFQDQRALADYVVKIHDDLQKLRTALEKDIHEQQDAGDTTLDNTHAAIDGKPGLIHAHDATEPYLGYSETK